MGLLSKLGMGKKTSDNNTGVTTPYQAIGGENTVRQLANRFYDIMENAPVAAELLAARICQKLVSTRSIYIIVR